MNEHERLILITRGLDIIDAGRRIVIAALDDNVEKIDDEIEYIRVKLHILERTIKEVD